MDGIHRMGRGGRFALRMLPLLCTLALVSAVCFPMQALAYFSKPAVGISFGSSAINLTAGSSGTVGLNVSPSSEQQLPGCGMSICPQACNGLETPEGEVGACLNAQGWCTCAGANNWYTAYTQVTVSSSNPYVARASANGGALSIQALSPGTATITVYASLSKHVDNAASMTVNVSDPAPGSPSGGGSTGASGGSGGSSAGPSPSAGGSGSGGGTVSVTAAGMPAGAAATAADSEGKSDDEPTELDVDGKKVIVLKADVTDTASAAEELQKIAGTEGTCTFWSGGTKASPSISWTFKGSDIPPDADLNVDPEVQVSKKGTGDVAKLLADTKNAIVMDFAYSGKLPAPAEVYVRASGVYEDGSKVNLYTYNEDEQKFELVQDGIEVKDGYAVYSIDHCSVWALSDEDLTACVMPVATTTGTDNATDEVDATQVNVNPQEGMPFAIGLTAAIVVIVAAGIIIAIVSRKHARMKHSNSGVSGVSDVGARS